MGPSWPPRVLPAVCETLLLRPVAVRRLDAIDRNDAVDDRQRLLGGRLGRDEGSYPEAAALGQNVILMVFGL